MIPTSIDGTDITGATIDGTDVTEITVDGDTVFTAGPVPAPVNRMYVARFGGNVTQFDTTNKFDLTGATQTANFSVGGQPRDVSIAGAGEYLYVAYYTGGEFKYYEMSTPYDISSLTLQGTVSGQPIPHGISVSEDGNHAMMVDDHGSGTVEYYTLSTPYDITTRSFETSANVSDNCSDVDYVNQGAKVLLSTGAPSKIIWDLTTAYDFTSRTNKQTFSNPSTERGVHLTDDGTKLIFSNYVSDTITEFSLSTPYDVSSRTSLDTLSVSEAIGILFV